MNESRKVKVLLIGQTPPPYHGQALTIQRLVEGQYRRLKIYHVRMAYSKTLDEVGEFQIRKVFHLAWVIVRVLWVLVSRRIDVVHYPPAGGKVIPVLRDIIALGVIRLFSRKILFVSHASGLYEWLTHSNGVLRRLARLVYSRADGFVQLSSNIPPIGKYLRAKRVFVIPNGLPDHAGSFNRTQRSVNLPPRILYVGMITEEKGTGVLLEAAKIMDGNGLRFTLEFVGEFKKKEYETKLRVFIEKNNLSHKVRFLGRKVDSEKWDCYKRADIFAFPSYYSDETLPGVVIEAMMYSLPVVATSWRGIPDVVVDGQTGFLVPVRDPVILSNRLEMLIEDADLRTRMGQKARQRYLEHFEISKWYERMEEAFLMTADGADPQNPDTLTVVTYEGH
jgi:glycosyltransferase involved in cell wall biosynthesis